MNSIASTQEVIQFVNRNKTSGFMLKLDFEKAYDAVEWGCILESMKSWDFSTRTTSGEGRSTARSTGVYNVHRSIPVDRG